MTSPAPPDESPAEPSHAPPGGPGQAGRRHTWVEQGPDGPRLIPTTRAGRMLLALVRAVVLGLGLLIVLGAVWLFVDVGGAAAPSDRALLSFRGLVAALAILTTMTFVQQWRALERDHARRLAPRRTPPGDDPERAALPPPTRS